MKYSIVRNVISYSEYTYIYSTVTSAIQLSTISIKKGHICNTKGKIFCPELDCDMKI